MGRAQRPGAQACKVRAAHMQRAAEITNREDREKRAGTGG